MGKCIFLAFVCVFAEHEYQALQPSSETTPSSEAEGSQENRVCEGGLRRLPQASNEQEVAKLHVLSSQSITATCLHHSASADILYYCLQICCS